jgi:MFS family permease
MFNIAFSLGSFVGPIASGQLLQGLGIENGFYTLVGIAEGCFLLCIPLVIWQFPKKKRKEDQQTGVVEDASA